MMTVYERDVPVKQIKKTKKQKQLFKKLSIFSFLNKANELQLKRDRNLQIYQKNKR